MNQHPNRLRALCGLLFALAATPAFAQQVVRADIPFEFGAANLTLPAGQYTIVDRNQLVTISNESGNYAVAMVTQRLHPDPSGRKTMLVFHRYGPRYFLARVAADDTTSDVAMSTAERRVVKELRDVKAARNNQAPEVVMIEAARR